MSRVLSITLTAALVLTLGVASVLGAYSIVNAATGGPDTYGYYFTDSNEGGGPTYSWVELSGSPTATATGQGDDDCVFAPIGFSFDFYGVSYNNVNISSNGLLNFGTCWWDWENQPLPFATQPEPLIAVFWDDLNPLTGGEVYYETFGTTPNQTFVVEWYGVPHWNYGGAATFEVILYEGSNEIIMQYADTDFGNANCDWGASATVGIQQNGTNELEYSYNQAVITNPLAILFYLPPPNQPPDVPTLNSPGDGATDVVLTPDLVFDYSDPDIDDCTSFDLQVDDNAGFGSPEIDDSVGGTWSSGSAITYTVSSPLALGTQYYWRVNVFDGTDWSGWSDGTWDFTTIPPNNPPNIPTLNSPSDGATDVVLTPDLVFNYSDPDTDDCTSFDLQVDDDAGFGSLEIDDSVGGTWSSGSAITYSVSTPLAPNTQYYWRANVSDGTDWSGWSDGSWDFTTGIQSGGSDKNSYRTNEDVTFDATGFPPGSDVDVYVVEDFAWTDSDSIPPGPGPVFAFDTFTANIDGEISGTIWYAPLERGEYDIVFDAGQDGIYDEIPDLVDDPNHPGFSVFSTKVGGMVYPIDKAALLLPWLGLGAVLILAAGGLILIRRRS